jgi:hypothetical protein
MKSLIEISKLLTRKKIRKIEILDSDTLDNRQSKFSEFYEALAAEKFRNDRDAAAYLYGCRPTDDKYRQLKSRFKRRLLNTLFFIDVNQSGTTEREKAYHTCQREWALVQILISRDAHLTAESLTRQVLGLALRYRFSEVVVHAARLLRHYAAEAADEKGFAENNDLIRQYSDLLAAEAWAEELCQRASMHYQQQAGMPDNPKGELLAWCGQLEDLCQQYDSPVLNYCLYLSMSIRFELERDFAAMLHTCQQALQYAADNPDFVQKDKMAVFHTKSIRATLHLRDFRHGLATAESGMAAFPEGSLPWFAFMECYLLLALHTGHYIAALSIMDSVAANPQLKKLEPEIRERWKVMGIYVNFFILEGRHDEVVKTRVLKNFRLSKFLEAPVLYPREQLLFAIQLLIAQVLFFIEKKNFAGAAEVIDQLQGYASKKLNKEQHVRIIHFIRLLQQLSKAKFVTADISGADKHLERLQEVPFYYRGQLHEIEAVPYEALWVFFLRKLAPAAS